MGKQTAEGNDHLLARSVVYVAIGYNYYSSRIRLLETLGEHLLIRLSLSQGDFTFKLLLRTFLVEKLDDISYTYIYIREFQDLELRLNLKKKLL